MTLTQKAEKRILGIMEENKKYVLRVSVKGGGCSGLIYEMRLEFSKGFPDVVIGTIKKGDNASEIITDKKSAPLLTDLTLDFDDGLNGQGFKYSNPNAKGTCGCGLSFKT